MVREGRVKNIYGTDMTENDCWLAILYTLYFFQETITTLFHIALIYMANQLALRSCRV